MWSGQLSEDPHHLETQVEYSRLYFRQKLWLFLSWMAIRIHQVFFHKLSGFPIRNFSANAADSYKNPKTGIRDILVQILNFLLHNLKTNLLNFNFYFLESESAPLRIHRILNARKRQKNQESKSTDGRLLFLWIFLIHLAYFSHAECES